MELPEQKDTTWDNYDLKFTAQFGNNHRLNLLNDDAVEGWRTRELSPDYTPVPSQWVLPRRAELRLRFEF